MATMIVIAVMCAIGLFFLLIAMIFYLLNRRREKKGEEKKRGYKIAETVFLVLGAFGLAPTIEKLFNSNIFLLEDAHYAHSLAPDYGSDGSYSICDCIWYPPPKQAQTFTGRESGTEHLDRVLDLSDSCIYSSSSSF